MRAAFAIALFAALSGCFQAQLNGPVSDATVTVTPLENPEEILARATTWDPDQVLTLNGGKLWNEGNAITRLWFLGIFQLDIANLDDNALYLVTASGGYDTDADGDRLLDDSYTPVNGQWRAIMTGEELKSGKPKVTTLSEAVYLWLQPYLAALNGDEIVLNRNRAAARLVADIDKSGTIDHGDVLSWSPQFHQGLLVAEPVDLKQISDHITAGGDEIDRRALAVALIDLEVAEESSASTEGYFEDHVADAVVICQSCHIAGGVADAGGARLIFGPPGSDDATNAAALDQFLTEVEGSGALVLSKIQGVDHGGGTWYTTQSPQFNHLATYIELVTGDDGGVGEPTGSFWDGLIMADARHTLRRAALIFSGRLPTDAEYAQAESGEAGLRAAIMGLLEGDGFHGFLIRGANDRLHTDAFLNGLFADVSDLNASYYPIGANKRSADQPTTEEEQQEKWRWENAWQFGLARAPLELIARVVENDRPYTEILTANYTMVNYQTSEILRSDVDFNGREDPQVFKPGRNRGQVPSDENLVSEFIQDIGTIVYAHGPFIDYPHAGVLNTQAFLQRYPSTETNRNRARARWTYLHFLDTDIEKSASRTTDPEALADTNNPTLNNPACTVCHEVMDPVAGAFQNYGNEGWYRSAWGGRDSLPDTYKYPEWFDENALRSPYREGDTWYRDMRTPGMPGRAAPDNLKSLQWLARQIVADPRFARATVKFWWPAVMGAAVLEPPGSVGDVGYQQQLNAFNQQTADIQDLAEAFADDDFNLKNLLVEMAMTGWFRASGVEPGADAGRELELETVGTGRLLTPAELENKTRALTGTAWDENPADWTWDGVYSALGERFRIYYGGIDSFGVKERARQLTSLMSNVALRQAVSHACTAVVYDFMEPDGKRRLFNGIERTTTPMGEFSREFTVTPDSVTSAERHRHRTRLEPGEKRLRMAFTNDFYDEAVGDRNLVIDSLLVRDVDGNIVIRYDAENLREVPGFAEAENAWGPSGDVHWGNFGPDGWILWSQGFISVPFTVEEAGDYIVSVTAWAQQAGPEPARMIVTVDGTTPWSGSAGEITIRQKLVELHELMLGETQRPGDEAIDAAYNLLVETWQARNERWPGGNSVWYWPDDNCQLPGDFWNLDRSIQDAATRDPENMLGSWVSVLMYLMTHYSYLHE